MGTDIHCVFQTKLLNGNWLDIPSHFRENRHYTLFGWIGDVRNGVGFAGCKMSEHITPLQSCRGYPEDFEVDDDRHLLSNSALLGWRLQYRNPDDPDDLYVWMGDHSHGWLSFDEILNADPPVITKYGIVTINEYKMWDKISTPESYCGGVGGANLLVSPPDQITDKTTHVEVEWQSDLKEELNYFIEEIARLQNTHGSGRIVFGFDS